MHTRTMGWTSPLPLLLLQARCLLGPDRILGVSAKNESEAREAVLQGADYLGVGAGGLGGGMAQLLKLLKLISTFMCPGWCTHTHTNMRTLFPPTVHLCSVLLQH